MEPVVAPRTFSGRYEVTHLIARGGMAQVYRARDTRLGRFVALKVLFPELSVDRTFVERFRREAQAAANLSHPNIVAVYDWGEDEGTYFIVMELITGTSLATALRAERTLPATRAATTAAQVASGLAYAHRNGVVHRDIKPGNVLLTDDGQVKVTDFGIAQAVSTEEGLTMVGSVMGTAAYFSPEQAEGAVVDGRSDIYSLGVVTYEMLAGRPPYVGDSPVAVASMHVRNEPPALRDLNPAVPVAIDQVVMKALAKSPDDRYQTADEFRADLLRFTEGVPVLAAAVGAAAGATGVLAGGTGQTSVVPARDTTMAVPAVAVMDGPVSDVATKKRSTPQRTAIAVGLAALVVVVGLLAWHGLSAPGTIGVPNVHGAPVAQAQATLLSNGLKLGTQTTVTSSLQAGFVVATVPTIGTAVKPGTRVSLLVSRGPFVNVTVPSVVNQNVQDAQTALSAKGLGFRLVPVMSWPTPVIPGTVLQQNPPANATAHSGSKVALTVLGSGGTSPLADVTDVSPGSAGATLGSYGLSVGSTTTACSTTAQGLVASTSPIAGTPVSQGQVVNLVVSSGACPVSVPNVVGETSGRAMSDITAAQLAPNIVACPTGPSTGTVASQSPVAHASAKPGSTVNAYLGCAATPTTTTTTTVPPVSSPGRGHHHRRRR